MALTKKEKLAMNEVQEGGDVYSYDTALTLRSVQRKHPTFINIGKAMAYKGNGTDRMPYFGAKLTDEGKRALRR